MNTRYADAFFRGGKLFFRALSLVRERTPPVGWGPVLTCDSKATPKEIGRTLRAALANSIIGVPAPKKLGHYAQEWAEASGAKSWGEFTRSASTCLVREGEGNVEIEPYAMDGEIYSSIKGALIRLQQPDDEALGKGILDGLAVSANTPGKPSREEKD